MARRRRQHGGDLVTTPEDPSGDRPVRRPSPASRARRIGGLSGASPSRQPPPATGPDVQHEEEQREEVQRDEPVALSTAPTSGAEQEPAAVPDDAASDEAAAEPRRVVEVPAWLRWLPALALGVAAIVMIVYFAVVSHSVWWGKPSANAVRDEVLSAAKQCFADANTYHYTSFAADEAKGAACTTGTWHGKYLDAMNNFVKKKAASLHVVQVAQVGQAGISSVSSDGRTWTIFVVGQLDIHATGLPKGRTDPVAALVQLVRAGGEWRISQLQEVAGPTS
jgi:hypothetical protein